MHVFVVYVGHVNVQKKFVYAKYMKKEEKNQFVGQPRDQNLFLASSSSCRIKIRILLRARMFVHHFRFNSFVPWKNSFLDILLKKFLTQKLTDFLHILIPLLMSD